MLDLVGLPKNVNGFRTTHTCELCGFEPKTKNKYREKQDHLVMKHFKEKIDKIFPHCRPYSCPTGNCGFTGKDKQALLRHYTGKHGILDKYLREALAEKGINYSHDSSKRKHHHHTSNNGEKAKQARLSPPVVPVVPSTSSVPTTLFIPASVPSEPNSIILQSRPNTEELKKEVEAMMATFQPVEPSQVVLFSSNSSSGSSPPQEHPVTTNTPPQEAAASLPVSRPTLSTSSMLTTTTAQPANHSILPDTCILPDSPPAEDMVQHGNGMVESNLALDAITLPALLAASPKAPSILLNPSQRVLQQIQQPPNEKTPLPSIRTIVSQVPLEILSSDNSFVTTTSALSAVDQAAATVVSSITTPISLASCHLDPTPTVGNGEVMWGSGAAGSLPAVVVESNNPVAYIETADGTYTAASIDQIDDYLYASTASTSIPDVRERQLDFCML